MLHSDQIYHLIGISQKACRLDLEKHPNKLSQSYGNHAGDFMQTGFLVKGPAFPGSLCIGNTAEIVFHFHKSSVQLPQSPPLKLYALL